MATLPNKLMSDRFNNFDLIRLFAALQVVYVHVIGHLDLPVPAWLNAWLRMFPGVPIFFMISGYMIYASYARSDSMRAYFIRRGLRIYPALWASILLVYILMFSIGYLGLEDLRNRHIWMWPLMAGTFLQFADYPVFANWGGGGANGALWTIAIELQFYLFVPILVLFFARFSVNERYGLLILSAVALLLNMTNPMLDNDIFFVKLWNVSLAPYLFWFCLGMMAHVHRDRLLPIVEGRFLACLAAYLAFTGLTAVLFQTHDAAYFLNPTGAIGAILLFLLVFSAAYSRRDLGARLLRGNDISYGVYLFHMLVIAVLMEMGMTGRWSYGLLAFAATIFLAILSWVLLERRALRLKDRFARPSDRAQKKIVRL